MKEKKSNKKIRFGIFCESLTLKSWQAECLRQVLILKNVELALIIQPKEKLSADKRSFFQSLLPPEGYSKILFYLYKKMLLRPKCYSAVNFSEKFKDIPSINYPIIKRNSSEYFKEENIEKIKNANMDFILLFSGFKNINGEILNALKYGVWSYHFDDIEKYRGGPPCFWEIYNNDHVNGAVLQRLTSKHNASTILKKGFFRTFKYSRKKSLDNVHFESTRWVKDVCLDILNDSANYIDNSPQEIKAPFYSAPNNIQFFKFCLKILRNKIRKIIDNLFSIEQWNIGYVDMPIDELMKNDKELKINWLLSPSKDQHYADPFVIKMKNIPYILFESYSYREKKGNICAIAFDRKGKKGEIKVVMERPYHLSYPFVFEYDNENFLIPCQWESSEIALYRVNAFPSNWEKIAVFVDNISAVDPTVSKYNDMWWLFCTTREEGPDLRLFIYYSENLFGPWLPHKKNPVKTDIRSSRSAGNVFKHNGNFIRPSQDNSKTYGGRIVLNKIIKLTPEEFEEEPVKLIEPSEKCLYDKGIHTINPFEDIIIVDGKRYIFSFSKLLKIITKKLGRIYPKKKRRFKYQFLDIPEFFSKSAYYSSMERIVEFLKSQDGTVSIYQIGSVNHPGISDLDIMVVFEDEMSIDSNPKLQFTNNENYLLTHSLGGICRSQFCQVNDYSIWHNLNHLWGEKFNLEKNLSKSEIDALKKQIALEYLVENYISLSIQLRYKVIKLRSLLQHIKAIRFDLELLGISSGKIYKMVNQLISSLDNWFVKPIDYNIFCEWIDKFYVEFKKFLEKILKKHPFYIPTWGNLKIGLNTQIEYGEDIGYKFSGFSIPKFIIGINRRIFNMNLRFNSFLFQILYSSIAKDKIIEDRYNYYKEVKKYASIYLPHFVPLITGFAYKIIK